MILWANQVDGGSEYAPDSLKGSDSQLRFRPTDLETSVERINEIK